MAWAIRPRCKEFKSQPGVQSNSSLETLVPFILEKNIELAFWFLSTVPVAGREMYFIMFCLSCPPGYLGYSDGRSYSGWPSISGQAQASYIVA